ncbi:MAG: hypothetical protein ACYDEY_03150 [Acidimicrobiales bacterium]
MAERAEISVGQAHNVLRATEQKRLVHAVGKGPRQRWVIDDRRVARDRLAVVDGARRCPPAATCLYARTEAEVVRRFAERAAEAGVAYAVTGAAGSALPGMPMLSRIVVTQVRVGGLQPREALAHLGLEHLEADDAGRGMNVDVWADNIGQVGTSGASEVDGVRVAPPIRVWLDLQRQGGRNVDAAQFFRERRRYALRIHAGPDTDGYCRLSCPAEDLSATASATASCLKLKPAKNPARKTVIRVISDDLGPVCKQHSVVFPAVEAAKYRQELQFQSPEWRAVYRLARGVIEGYNGFIKDGNQEALHEATRRRVRGRAALHLFCALILVSANLRKLAVWYLELEIEVIDEDAPKRRARRRSDTLADYRPDVVTPAAQDPRPPPDSCRSSHQWNGRGPSRRSTRPVLKAGRRSAPDGSIAGCR